MLELIIWYSDEEEAERFNPITQRSAFWIARNQSSPVYTARDCGHCDDQTSSAVSRERVEHGIAHLLRASNLLCNQWATGGRTRGLQSRSRQIYYTFHACQDDEEDGSLLLAGSWEAGYYIRSEHERAERARIQTVQEGKSIHLRRLDAVVLLVTLKGHIRAML